MTGELAERTLEIDGARHRWLEAGSGPPVVLVHHRGCRMQ